MELAVDGKKHALSCQPVRKELLTEREGDEIAVLYLKKRTLGLETFEVIADKPGERERIARNGRLAAYFLLAAGAALIAAGIACLPA